MRPRKPGRAVCFPHYPVVVPSPETPSLEVQEFVALHHHEVGNPVAVEPFPETHDFHRHIVVPEFAKDGRRGVADVFAAALVRELGPYTENGMAAFKILSSCSKV
jgi:hypothetical protein